MGLSVRRRGHNRYELCLDKMTMTESWWGQGDKGAMKLDNGDGFGPLYFLIESDRINK